MVGQARSTQRLEPPVPSDDEELLRAFLRAFSTDRPRWGWRRAGDAARDAGWQVNDKRIHRLWRDEGLRVPYKKKKRLRGVGVLVGAMCPIRPNVIWGRSQLVNATGSKGVSRATLVPAVTDPVGFESNCPHLETCARGSGIHLHCQLQIASCSSQSAMLGRWHGARVR